MTYSFVIPLYNEAESLEELHKKITKVSLDLGENYEVVFIDDGSTDFSFDVLKKLYLSDSHTAVFQFRKNLGKSAALQKGFMEAKGDIIITLDADLQDDPLEIKKLLERLSEGFDLVSSWKKQRKDPLNKRLPSRFFNMVVRFFSGVPIHDFNSGLKVYKREVVKELNLYGELHRFIPVIVAAYGFKVGEMEVSHYPRKFGTSKYGLSRLPRGFFDFLTVLFLTQFGKRPSHLFGGIGIVCLFFGFVFGSYLTFLRVSGEKIGERPLLFLTILLILSGFQFVFTGLLAEMLLHLTPKQHFPIKRILRRDD